MRHTHAYLGLVLPHALLIRKTIRLCQNLNLWLQCGIFQRHSQDILFSSLEFRTCSIKPNTPPNPYLDPSGHQGHGFQAAVGPPVFALLNARLGVAFECFASPLNTYFGHFCSAFPDTDAPFGSSGSFFKVWRTGVGASNGMGLCSECRRCAFLPLQIVSSLIVCMKRDA